MLNKDKITKKYDMVEINDTENYENVNVMPVINDTENYENVNVMPVINDTENYETEVNYLHLKIEVEASIK